MVYIWVIYNKKYNMKIDILQISDLRLGEVISEDSILWNLQSGLDLISECFSENIQNIIIYTQDMDPVFWNLKTWIAGEILQKFTNYGIRIFVVWDFVDIKSNSLRDFVYESNKGKSINFVAAREDAIARLSS